MTRQVLSLLLLSLLLACDRGDHLSSTICESPCYTGPAKTRHIGSCHDGTPVCDRPRHVIQCADEVTPKLETCNNLDDDCNGVVDDNLLATTPGNEKHGDPCGTSLGVCTPGILKCLPGGTDVGGFTCVGGQKPQMEDCSGRDLDCNGTANDIKRMVCYDGDPKELTYPLAVCRAGFTACINYQVQCAGEVLPQLELCTDVIDKNCDGLIGSGASGPVDIVFLLDRDGEVTASVQLAIKTFVLAHSSNAFRYSVIDVPGLTLTNVNGTMLALPQLSLNAVSASVLLAASSTFLAFYGSVEYPLVALHDAAIGAYRIDWQVGSRKFIVWFGDDNDCSEWDTSGCFAGVPAYTVQDVILVLKAAQITFISFADTTTRDYLPIALATGGAAYTLMGQSSATLTSTLTALITPNCQ